MSYKNPPIIVDRSTDVWGKAIAGFGQQLAQGIISASEALRKSKEAQAEQTRKDRLALQKLETTVSEKYNDQARDKYIALKKSSGESIANQFKDNIDSLLNGTDDQIGVIDARVQLELNAGLDDATRKEYTKIVDDYKMYQTQAVDGFGKIIASTEEVAGKDTSMLGYAGGWIFKGKDRRERLDNQLAYYAINTDVMVNPDVIEKRKTSRGENGENYLETTTLVPVEQFNDGGSFDKALSKEEISKLTKETVNGKSYYKFDFKRDVNVWDGDFTVDIPSSPDYTQVYNESNIEKDGAINASLTGVVSITEGNKILNQEIIDVNAVRNNSGLEKVLLGQAASINNASDAEIEAYLNFAANKGGLSMSELNSNYPSPRARREYIKNVLIDSSIESKFMDYAERQATQTDVDAIKQNNPNSNIKIGDPVRYKTLKTEEIEVDDTVDASYVVDLEIPVERIDKGVAGGVDMFLNLPKLEETLAKKGFTVKKAETVDGKQTRTITKSVKGADRSVTIYEDMNENEVKALLVFLETGKNPVSKPQLP